MSLIKKKNLILLITAIFFTAFLTRYFFANNEFIALEKKLKAMDVSFHLGKKKNGAMFLWFHGWRIKPLDLSELQGASLWGIDFSDHWILSLSPLKGMKLEKIDLYGCQISDLSPLKGMPIQSINLKNNKITDIEPIINPYLEVISIGNKVMCKKEISADNVNPEVQINMDNGDVDIVEKKQKRNPVTFEYYDQLSVAHIKNIELLKSLKNLKKINNKSVEEFFKKYESGELSATLSKELKNCKKNPEKYLESCLMLTSIVKNKFIILEDITTNPVIRFRLNKGETVNGITLVNFDIEKELAILKYRGFTKEIPFGLQR